MPPAREDRLDSWKEIAAYLRRGVRTVRRWEREENLPVHRHRHNVLGSVYAYKSEIDSWQRTERRRFTAAYAAAQHGPEDSRRTRSIAVLPFTSLSTEPDNDYFADGLTEEVTTSFSKISALRVISRTSAMTYKRTSKEITTIARELGVCYVLEGSVRRAADQLRITARLVDATRDDYLWSETFEGTVADVFAIQERIARVIVAALALQLTPAEDRRLADRSFTNVHAYECYLQARHEAWRWRGDAIDHAIQLLHNGLTLVGPNVKLYAGLGHAHLQYREAGIDLTSRPLDEAEDCVRKIFDLEAGSPSGLQLRAWIRYGRGHIQESVWDLKAALEAEPNNPDTLLLLTNCYVISGKVPAARPLIERLQVVDPLTPISRCMGAFADAMEGNLPAAVQPYRQMFEMDPGNPMARLFYLWVLVLNGRADSIEDVLRSCPADVRETVPARLGFFLTQAVGGHAHRAHAAITEDVEAAAVSGPDLFARMIAEGYGLIGAPAEALHWLRAAMERGFINYPFIAQHDPCFTAVRSDARFADLLALIRERWERFEP